jgi:pyruvate formate lyase activating enzyme
VAKAEELNLPSISYTYNEPTIFLEYALDTMKLAHEKGLKNIWVSNGFMSEKTLALILPYLDAINVDLKSFSKKFYQEICGTRLAPILDNLIRIKKAGAHLEITTLIIPTKNDSPKELKQIAEFIKNELGAETPWHVTAFYPTYKMKNLPPTAEEKILEAKKMGEEAGLKWVHTGNV